MAVSDPIVMIVLGGVVLGGALFLALRLRAKRRKPVVIDGSNVMYWKEKTPRIDTLRDVVGALKQAGFRPGVIFDANAGYLLFGHYANERRFARHLKLRPDAVIVVPKGEPADPTILAAARHLGAQVISNDRFRDWVDDFPEINTPGHIVRGGFRDGAPWLDLPAPK